MTMLMPMPNTGRALSRSPNPHQVACSSLTDRHACCNAIDGGTAAYRAGYACMPAMTRFQNGNRCETARYVEQYDPSASASCAEFSPTAAHLTHESLHHEVQRLTLQQARPSPIPEHEPSPALSLHRPPRRLPIPHSPLPLPPNPLHICPAGEPSQGGAVHHLRRH